MKIVKVGATEGDVITRQECIIMRSFITKKGNTLGQLLDMEKDYQA